MNNKIVEMRLKNGYSQSQFAKMLNIGVSTLCNYEKGYRKYPIHILKAIAKIFDCKIDDLV